MMARELPLADLIPLWRTLREQDVTAIVTPALDYVGGLELGTLDIPFAGDEQIASIGEGLRSFIASLDDDTTLHFLCRVEEGAADDIREYEAICAGAGGGALGAFAAGRAAWLRSQGLRRTRLYLFFSGQGGLKQGIGRGLLGGRLLFAKSSSVTKAEHGRRLARLGQLRDRVGARLAATGIPSRELAPEDFQRIHYRLLNPSRAGQGLAPPRVRLRDTEPVELVLGEGRGAVRPRLHVEGSARSTGRLDPSDVAAVRSRRPDAAASQLGARSRLPLDGPSRGGRVRGGRVGISDHASIAVTPRVEFPLGSGLTAITVPLTVAYSWYIF